MFTHKIEILIICKFKFEEKCLFKHFKINELNKILTKLEDLILENNLLKSDLKEKDKKIRILSE